MAGQKLPPLAEQWVQNLQSDTYSGAAALTRKLLEAFSDVARNLSTEPAQVQRQTIHTMGMRLIESFPSMTSIRHCVEHFEQALSTQGLLELLPPEFTERTLNAIEDYEFVLDQSARRVTEKSLQALQQMEAVMTISSSSTVKRVLQAAWARQMALKVYVAESQPGGEGVRFAQELGERAAVIPDMGMMQHINACDAVVVGADTLADTFFINKVGTYLMALAAKECGIPFYILTESQKIRKGKIADFPQEGIFEQVPLHLVTQVIVD